MVRSLLPEEWFHLDSTKTHNTTNQKQMKIKLITLLAGFAMIGAANAATVTVSPGLAALGQGVRVFIGATEATSFLVSVGGWDGVSTTFTPFAAPAPDTGTVNGEFTAQGPASLSDTLIYLFVGNGTSIAESMAPTGSYMVFSSTQGTKFPANLVPAGGTTFSAALSTGLNPVAGSPGTSLGTNRINLVPEPGVAALGLIGLLGLVRRRR